MTELNWTELRNSKVLFSWNRSLRTVIFLCALCLVTQSCPTLCNLMDCQAALSTGIHQARILEWVAMPSSRGSSQLRDWTQVPHCRWILNHLSHQGSSRILEWVAYPFSRGFSWPRVKPRSPALHADSLPAELPVRTYSSFIYDMCYKHVLLQFAFWFCLQWFLLAEMFTSE